MCAKWNNGTRINPHHVISFFQNLKTNNTSKPYHIFREEFSEVLSTGMSFNPSIPKSQHSKLMDKAIDFAERNNSLTPDGIKTYLNRIEKDYLSNKPEKYSLLTKISIDFPQKRMLFKFLGTTFIFSEQLPVSINTKFDKRVLPKILQTEDLPYNYSWLRVITYAKSPSEASEKSFSCIEIFSGIINFLLSYGTIRITTNKHLPLSKIGIGPYHLLYDKNNKLIKDLIYYSSDYYRYSFPTSLDKHLKNWKKTLLIATNRILKPPDRDTLLNLMERYSSAQSSTNLELAFLNFWSLLETLTNTTGEPYDKTISRSSVLHKNHHYAKSELNHLRILRNRAIHTGAPIQNQETPLFQIKKYVDKLLSTILFNKAFSNTSLEMIGKILDTPIEESSRKRLIQNLRLASKI